MKIAVVSANGQLGTELVEAGNHHGHDVIGFTQDEVQVETQSGVQPIE